MKRYIPFTFTEKIEKTSSGYFKGIYKGKARYFDTSEDAEKYEKEGGLIDKVKADQEKKRPKKIGHENEHGYVYDDHDAQASGKKHGHTWEIKNGKKTEYAVKDEDLIDVKNNPEGVKKFKTAKERDKYLAKITDKKVRSKKLAKDLKKDQDSHMVGDIWTTKDGKKIAVKYKKKGEIFTDYIDIEKAEGGIEGARKAAEKKLKNSK